MEHLIEFAVFFGKLLLVFLFIVGLVLMAMSIALRNKLKPELEIEDLNEKIDNITQLLKNSILDKKALKAAEKELKKKIKERGDEVLPHTYLLKFNGDVQAQQVEEFREEITALLTVAKAGDEVIITIESPGGTVHGYGLAAAQILRLKKAGLKVIACVDKVAASGGYLMACTADKILAAPFAIIGSIGVIAQVPNFNRLLKKNNVDYEEISAGEFKRTLTVLGEITDKGRAKFKEQIEDTHLLFKNFVKELRPQVDLQKVATGEYWFGTRAKDLLLVDELMTSDEYILSAIPTRKIISVKIQHKKKLSDKIGEMFEKSLSQILNKTLQKLMGLTFP